MGTGAGGKHDKETTGGKEFQRVNGGILTQRRQKAKDAKILSLLHKEKKSLDRKIRDRKMENNNLCP